MLYVRASMLESPSLPILHRLRLKNQRICFCTSICPDSTFLSYSVNLFVRFISLSVILSDNPKDVTATLVAPTSTLATAVQTPAAPAVYTNFLTDTNLWSIVDPDIVHENPVEDKHRRLVRSHRSSPYDRDLKPNAKNRDELAVRPHSFLPLYLDMTVPR
jgi:hypothetical protein